MITAAHTPVPKVLLRAKLIAKEQSQGDRQHAGGGPWDKGHWANRK